MTSGTPPVAGDQLRAQWWQLASGYGWATEIEWRLQSVDALCEALSDGRDPWAAAERLGFERAAASIPLSEALVDIDLLASLVSTQMAETLRRAVSLGWSARTSTPPIGIVDPLTGLTSLGYLQVRLGEVYRALDAKRLQPDEVALVLVRIESTQSGLGRNLPMMLLAEGMRAIFDAGETLSMVSETTMAVLARRDAELARRIELGRSLAQRVIDRDRHGAGSTVRAWIEPLPGTAALAAELLESSGR